MILVFAGSGASAAVDPEFLTTVKFFDQLPSDIKEDELFKDALEFIKRGAASESPPDIEHILWALNDLENFATIRTKDLSGFLIKNNLITKYSSNKFDVSVITSNLELIKGRVKGLISKINRVVHDVYAKDPDQLDFNNNWYPLLKNIKRLGLGGMEIFTTNYDLILEKVMSDIRIPVSTGRGTGTIRKLETELWKEKDISQALSEEGLLTKLHGSIDWIRHSNGSIQFTTEFIEHKRQAIIYPGFKDEPREEPFISFHRYLELAASRASAAVFIGYAFRDEYINSILRARLQSIASIYLIGLGPAPTDIPFSKGRYEYLDNGFNSDSAFEIVKRLEKRLNKH